MRDHAAWVAFIESRQGVPFAWGRQANDCISFAGQAVRVLTGDDVLARCGHDWATHRGALRVLAKLGGLAAAADLMLTPLRSPGLAQRGDIGLVETGAGPALVVVEGHTAVGPGPAGLVRVARRQIVQAWSAT